jgi:2-polyprenyl-3-methyl-5-hydroxy-6-metoxy-1,4-benzoquinol methylase
MNAETMQAYYRENFGSVRHLQGQAVNARTNRAVLPQLIDLKNVKSWLDVGTGYGFLLKWLKEHRGIRTVGVELSTQEADYAREKQGLEVHSKLLAETGLPRESFDVVSCFEVIEHISDPNSFVRDMAEFVRPGGYLIVMTDNFESTCAEQLKGGFPKWIPHSHISLFGPQSLRNCMHSVPGIKIVKEASYTPWDMVGRQCVSLFRKPPSDGDAFNLRAELASEMNRNYKLYQLRYRVNPFWVRMTVRPTLDGGALMYAVGRKQG